MIAGTGEGDRTGPAPSGTGSCSVSAGQNNNLRTTQLSSEALLVRFTIRSLRETLETVLNKC